MRDYLTPIVEDRKAHPRDDLVSDIVTAEVDGERLSDEHIYGFLRLLLPAGAETTYRAMGSCLYALLSHPEVLDQVRADRSLLPEVIEETLRWETSVTMVNRESMVPVEVAGTMVPVGGSVVCALGSANRDETQLRRRGQLVARPRQRGAPGVRHGATPVPRHAPRPARAAHRPGCRSRPPARAGLGRRRG